MEPTLQQRARAIRAAVVRMAHVGRTAHVGSSLSCVDVLTALYFHALRVDPREPARSEDRFILSKGHGAMAYYATLAERGYFAKELLAGYSQNGTALAEHPSPVGIPGCEVGTGSLGHGLSIANGAALARKLQGRPGRQFVLLSDGECNEGSVWEAALFAGHRQLDNLVVLVDHNKLQAMGSMAEISGLMPLADKFASFGFSVRELDGHHLGALCAALDEVPFVRGKPTAIVAHTTKGKGVSFMENDTEWHYRPPNDADLARALAEIGS
jgi:transketolase